MNAAPALVEIGRCLDEINLEAVLIGNAAAALRAGHDRRFRFSVSKNAA